MRKEMTKKILIVDDDPYFISSTRKLLEESHYSIISAFNGKEGFKKAGDEQPDAIVLDVMMENAGAGLDTVKKLRDDPSTSHIPVILLTAIRKAEYLMGSFEPGESWPNVKAALEKPLPPDSLIETLEKILSRRPGTPRI